MSKRLLVINAGSSSVKCALFEMASVPSIEPHAPVWAQDSEGETSVEQALSSLPNDSVVDVVGHRVVHGADEFDKPTLIDDSVKQKIGELAKFAPLHNKLNLQGIEAAQRRFPQAKHVAVFDTSFHRTIPEEAAVYPIPRELSEKYHIRRYGFHGINHEYCTLRAATMLGRNVHETNLIICHLGSGCSLTAVRSGQSVDNTMGFTPLEGLMMGTRSGSIDPGIILRLANEVGIEETDHILNKQSGLLGVSGVSNDLRQVMQAAKSKNERSQLAIDMFVYRLKSYIGGLAAQLPRVDALVFSAGIGEHAAQIRARACEALHGACVLDVAANENAVGDTIVSAKASKVAVMVIAAREDWQIARACWPFAKAN